jgi:hypothetical protein
MNRIPISGLLVVCLVAVAVTAQEKAGKPKTETKEAKIARALSAGPANIAKAAKVVDRDENGKEIGYGKATMALLVFLDTHRWLMT